MSSTSATRSPVANIDQRQSSKLAGRTAVDSALDLMEALKGDPRSLTELARATGLSKSGAHKTLATLLRRGYLQALPDKRYSYGPAVLSLGLSAIKGMTLKKVALPEMQKLASETQETVLLSILADRSVLYVERVASTQPVAATAEVGSQGPLHCTATGKAILAHISEHERQAYYERGLERYSDRTITTREALEVDLKETVDRGYAVNRGEWRGEVFGVGTAVLNDAQRPQAAIAITVPAYRFTESLVPRYGQLLKTASDGIQKAMGWAK